MKRNNLKQKYLVFLVMLSFIVIGLYYSYAIFVSRQLQENVTYVKTATSQVQLQESEFTILKNSEKEVSLFILNNSLVGSYYEVFFQNKYSNIQVTSLNAKGYIEGNTRSEIKVLIKNENDFDISLSFLLKTSSEDDIVKETEDSYINKDASFDHSKANKPQLADFNLIPVVYHHSEEISSWYKADESNTKSLWYDYDNGIWANAVLVSSNTYRKYQQASVDTPISEDDILGYFVWIPRFKYVLLNSNNYTNYEQIYNVIFEEGNNSTGTIVCSDKISNDLDMHLYSEVCYDNKYNKIYDNLSSYTHPAFRDKEGFWVFKFLVSETGGYKSIPNATMLKKNIDDAISISNDFINAKSHLLTNMEYASITILTNSNYGKSNNSNYFSKNNYTFKRVYSNNSLYNITGCSSNYNNFSKSFITSSTKECTPYNDLTNYTHISNSVSYNIGEVGPGASSSGTIYGVYDMANIDGELVAGFVANQNGKIDFDLEYYDVYSYSNYVGKISSSNTISKIYRYKYGDAIKENIRTLTEYGMWQGGSIEHKEDSSVILRGGRGDAKSASIYTTTVVKKDYEAPFRICLFK